MHRKLPCVTLSFPLSDGVLSFSSFSPIEVWHSLLLTNDYFGFGLSILDLKLDLP